MTQTSTMKNESIKLISPLDKKGRSVVVSAKPIAPMWHEQPNQFDSNYKEGSGE